MASINIEDIRDVIEELQEEIREFAIDENSPGELKQLQARLDEIEKAVSPTTTGVGQVFYDRQINYLYQELEVTKDRFRNYDLAKEMYDSDEIMSSQIDNVSSSATIDGCTVEVTGADLTNDPESLESRAQLEIDTLLKRIKWRKNCGDVAKRALLYGDDFYEVIVDMNTMEVIDLKQRPRKSIDRAEDDTGELIGFAQRERIESWGVTPYKAYFQPWQILHFRWNRIDDMYGRSYFKSMRSTFKKLELMEKDMVIRRRTRAGQKLIHYPNLEVLAEKDRKPLSWVEVDEYVKRNQSRRDTVRTNYYSNGLWKIEAIQGDDTLGSIEDIEYFQEKKYVGGKVPKGLLSSGEDVNRATLDRQDIGYMRLLNEVTDMLDEEIERLIKFQLIIKGIDYDLIDFDIKWREKSREDEIEWIKALTEIYKANTESGLPIQVIFDRLGLTIDDIKSMYLELLEMRAEIDMKQNEYAHNLMKDEERLGLRPKPDENEEDEEEEDEDEEAEEEAREQLYGDL